MKGLGIMDYLFIGLGGSLGALARYTLNIWVQKRWHGRFPVGTFLINLSGSFIMGMVFILFTNVNYANALLESATMLGFLGAYTTYSTFAYEIVVLMEHGQTVVALQYLLASIFVGLTLFFLAVNLAGEIVLPLLH